MPPKVICRNQGPVYAIVPRLKSLKPKITWLKNKEAKEDGKGRKSITKKGNIWSQVLND